MWNGELSQTSSITAFVIDRIIIADDGEKDRDERDLTRKIMAKILRFLAGH